MSRKLQVSVAATETLTFLEQKICDQIKQRLLKILEVSRRLIDLFGTGLPPLGAIR